MPPPSSLLRSGMTVMAGSGAVNILNYLFTIIVGRMLSASAFGEITALFALQLITGVPSAAITMLTAKFIAQFHGAGQAEYVAELMRRMHRMIKILGLATAVVFLLLSPFIADLLHIALLPVILFAVLTIIGLSASLYQGVLQGTHRFSHFAWMNVIATASKLVLGFALVALGYSVNGVMVALLIGALLSAAYGYRSARRALPPHGSAQSADFPSAQIVSYAKVISAVTLLSALFVNIDILMAKAYLSPEMAGRYSALTVVGKIVLYGAGAFVTIVLPLVASAGAQAHRRKQLLRNSLLIVSFLSVAAASLFSAFPGAIITLILGKTYETVAPDLALYAWAMALGTIAMVLINYLIARQSTLVLVPLAIGLLIETVSIILFHSALSDFVGANIVANAALLLSAVATYFYANREMMDSATPSPSFSKMEEK